MNLAGGDGKHGDEKREYQGIEEGLLVHGPSVACVGSALEECTIAAPRPGHYRQRGKTAGTTSRAGETATGRYIIGDPSLMPTGSRRHVRAVSVYP